MLEFAKRSIKKVIALRERKFLYKYFRKLNTPMSEPVSGPQKILCIQVNAIGDTIMTQPAWSAIKKKYPGMQIDLLCQSHVGKLFESDPNLERIISFPPLPGLRPWKKYRIIDSLKLDRYDCIIDFSGLPPTAYLCSRQISAFSAGFSREMDFGGNAFEIGRGYDRTIPFSETKHLRSLMFDLAKAATLNL